MIYHKLIFINALHLMLTNLYIVLMLPIFNIVHVLGALLLLY